MTEVVDILLAGRHARFELDDAELASELRARCAGFVVADTDTPAPWLRLAVSRLPDAVGPVEHITLRQIGPGTFAFVNPRARGTLRMGPSPVVEVEVSSDLALMQVVHLGLAMALPAEGAVVLHADVVEWQGRAVAFLGASGAGKSTAAARVVARGGRLVAADRAVVQATGDGVRVLTLPRMSRREDLPELPLDVPLACLLFPKHGRGASMVAMPRLKAFQSLLQVVNLPGGDGLPVAEALAIVERILETVWVGELEYELGRDFTGELESRIATCPTSTQRPSSRGTPRPRSGSSTAPPSSSCLERQRC
jgi:hypothetical protein